MRVDKDLQWMKPYIAKALAAFPKLKAVKHIHCVETTFDLEIDQPAVAYADGGPRSMEIFLALYLQKKQTKYKHNLVAMVEFLAHEFCHVYFEGHVPVDEFIKTEAKIMEAMVDTGIREEKK